MKRMVATRQLRRRCIYCDTGFQKGDVYYKDREVFEECGKVYASESLVCPKCKYRNEARKERFDRFKKRCDHKEKYMVYRYVPGESVMEPDYERCMICGQIV